MSSTISLCISPAVIVTAALARDVGLIVGVGVAIIVLLLLAPNAAREAGQTLQDKARRCWPEEKTFAGRPPAGEHSQASRFKLDKEAKTMTGVIESGLLLGLGVLSLTREKAEAIVEDLVKRGEVRRDEARELVDRLVARGGKEREALSDLVRDEVEEAIGAMNLASKADIDALAKKLDALTRKAKSD